MQLNNVKSTHHNHHYGYAIRNFAIEYLSQKTMLQNEYAL